MRSLFTVCCLLFVRLLAECHEGEAQRSMEKRRSKLRGKGMVKRTEKEEKGESCGFTVLELERVCGLCAQGGAESRGREAGQPE